jgi:hypothetical protein
MAELRVFSVDAFGSRPICSTRQALKAKILSWSMLVMKALPKKGMKY